MRNKKGFTLIELLAVIIILGVLMIIAIPSVTNYISNSRYESYVKTAKQLISGARNLINTGDLDVYDTSVSYFLPVSCIKSEKGESESPYGEFDPAYVIVQYNGTGYEYYWLSRDTQGIGVRTPINEKKLSTDYISNDIQKSRIKTNVKVNGRKFNVVFNEDCSEVAETNVVTQNLLFFFNDLEESRTDIIERDNTEDNNLRFYGGGPDNYVTFNGEVGGWRIIGTFDDKIKIIRAQSIGTMQFNNNSSTGSNNYANSTLCNYLNTTYYDGLTDEAKSMITVNTWYIDGSNSLYVPAADIYAYEREHATLTWTGKVGLMSMSDYLYAAGSSCTNLNAYNSNGNDIRQCRDSNWLYTGISTWMITPSTASTPWVRLVESTGAVNGYIATNSLAVRPVVFLKTEVELISGSGTISDPYILGF